MLPPPLHDNSEIAREAREVQRSSLAFINTLLCHDIADTVLSPANSGKNIVQTFPVPDECVQP